MHEKTKNYLPALRFEFLTRFYDPLVRCYDAGIQPLNARFWRSGGFAKRARRFLISRCGTGTLDIGIKRRFPESKIYGFDVDEEILHLWRAKRRRKIIWKFYTSKVIPTNLPFENENFDRVFSTLFFHHLNHERKRSKLCRK